MTTERKKFIIDALNLHGTLLHQRCIFEIANNQNWTVIDKEVPICIEQDKTRIDIIGKRPTTPAVNLIVECKKADKDFKSWIFFPDKKMGDGDWSFTDIDEAPIIVDTVSSNNIEHPADVVHSIRLFTLRSQNGQIKKVPIAYDGYEIKIDTEKEGKINNNNLPSAIKKPTIEDACRQVILGTKGYADQFKKRNKTKLLVEQFFLSVIITTAKLSTCELNPQDVDLKSGTIEHSKLELKEHPWLIYNYKPEFIFQDGYPSPEFKEARYQNTPLAKTVSVFIVNSEHLTEFLDIIAWSHTRI